MNKEQKIEAIYKEIANKELSFGCVVNWIDNMIYDFYYVWFTGFWNSGKMIFQRKWWLTNWDKSYKQILSETFNRKKVKIIWHPVLIWDVLDYIKEEVWGNYKSIYINYIEFFKNENELKLEKLWKNKRLPIESQSEECINYIYNLIGEWKK